MNTNINSNRTFSLPVYHAPMIVDSNTRRVYRRWGHVSWPKKGRGISDRFINKIRNTLKPCLC